MRWGAALVGAAVLSGCAARRPQVVEPAGTSLESYMGEVRQLSVAARPQRPTAARSLEQNDPGLMAARMAVEFAPTADNHRELGEAYLRLGVLDAAYTQFSTAVRLNSHDAGSLDALARIWRDWGLPNLGLGDAYRAIDANKRSPVPLNTLGTLLLKMGLYADARDAFRRALALDSAAPYALNNLCYTSLLQGRRIEAVDTCQDALRLQPGLVAAQHNLALAYAASGDITAAATEFARAGKPGDARFNLGVALLATGRFDEAAAAFDDAASTSAAPNESLARAREARRLANAAAATTPTAAAPASSR